jgi:hypothetical protein
MVENLAPPGNKAAGECKAIAAKTCPFSSECTGAEGRWTYRQIAQYRSSCDIELSQPWFPRGSGKENPASVEGRVAVRVASHEIS